MPVDRAGRQGAASGGRNFLSFVDTSKSVGLTDAPQPGSVSQAVFVGESRDRKCAELDRASRITVTEQNSNISSLVRDRERAESNNNTW